MGTLGYVSLGCGVAPNVISRGDYSLDVDIEPINTYMWLQFMPFYIGQYGEVTAEIDTLDEEI